MNKFSVPTHRTHRGGTSTGQWVQTFLLKSGESEAEKSPWPITILKSTNEHIGSFLISFKIWEYSAVPLELLVSPSESSFCFLHERKCMFEAYFSSACFLLRIWGAQWPLFILYTLCPFCSNLTVILLITVFSKTSWVFCKFHWDSLYYNKNHNRKFLWTEVLYLGRPFDGQGTMLTRSPEALLFDLENL